jgi:hypothetical protein
MIAMQMDIAAILGCHSNGIVCIPFLFSTAMVAVERKQSKVSIPRYIISGLPKIKW